jgi:nucleoside-diphosphate-sugar epimerase
MGRLLVSGADGNVSRHLVNALAANGHRRRGGDIRHPMRERSPTRLMSHAAPGHPSITAG